MGRSVPVMKCEDVDDEGRVHTLHFLGNVKKRSNSLVATWDAKAWEIDRAAGKISYIDDKGIESHAFVVAEEGITTGIYTRPITFPNREEIIGKAATMDDIADAMDLGKSMRNIVIGLLIGICIGWWFVAPIVSGMAK